MRPSAKRPSEVAVVKPVDGRPVDAVAGEVPRAGGTRAGATRKVSAPAGETSPAETRAGNARRREARPGDPEPLRILGLDPGSRRLGFGILQFGRGAWARVESGVFRLPEKESLPNRLDLAFDRVSELISAHRPQIIAVEDCFVSHRPRAALVLGHIRGVLLLAATRSGARVTEYAPRSVKLATVGNGAAAKEQVQAMVPRLVRDCPTKLTADEADALAVAWCCANQLRLGTAALGRRP